ncbi:MAG: hypothetical protein EBR82_16710 [Caulobacteraceae bacterium]|nr:hypothetical protein [Caulobacteraceae bacterium]
MSFREKHLWISIVSSVAVWGWYFVFLIRHLTGGWRTDDHFTAMLSMGFMTCLILVVLIEGVLTFVATAITPKAERKMKDEREIHAALKASHIALMALIALIFCVGAAAWFTGVVDDNFVGGRAVFSVTGNVLVVLANVLVACLVLTELVRAGVTLMLLRGLR